MSVKEKIIFSNNLNETELLRTLSKNGNNTFGVRVLNDVEICSYILVRNGKSLDGRYISDKEQAYIYFSILNASLSDATNIKNAINTFRDCILTDSLNEMNNILSNDFKLKKDTITETFAKYIEYKKNNNLYDKYDMIEFIIDNKLKVSNVDLEYFTEFDITASFKSMINEVFDKVNEISISKYFNNDKPNIDIVKVYGKSNEIEAIFNKINKDNIPLDNCQIILANSKDMTEILPYLNEFNITYTTGVGVPFIETNPAKLLKLLIDLKNRNYGVDGYKDLFNSSVFNTKTFTKIFTVGNKLDFIKYNDFIKYAGWLRIGYDNKPTINNKLYDADIAKALNTLNNDMQKGILPFIIKYVRNDKSNPAIISKMEELINAKNIYALSTPDDELLSELFSSFVNKQVSTSGSIHVTSIDNAFASIREYNFFIGLDEDFPCNAKENYLIYDDEYKKTKSDLYLSKKIIERKIARTKKLIELSNNVMLSYSYYGLFDLKEKNPSSIIYDLLSENKEYSLKEFLLGEDKKHPVFDFTSSDINENTNVIKSRINNNTAIITKSTYSITYDPKALLEKKYNPSSIVNFFEEGGKFGFILANIYEIKIDEEDNPYNVIPANEKGTLIHSLVENFNKKDISKSDFINKGVQAFEEFLEKRPPIIVASEDKEKEDYKNLISNLYDMEKYDSTCIVCEEEIDDVKVSNICFKGKFDRVEKDKDGNYILVDYKTGRNITHVDGDPVTCIQGLIYAYMIEHTNNPKIKALKMPRLSRIEFRYPYAKKIVSIDYSKANEKSMTDKIEEFKKAILNHEFKCTEEDVSRYDTKYQKLLSLYKEVLS